MPTPAMRALARRLLAVEAASTRGDDAHGPAAVRVCEKLRLSLTSFAGADGFASLLRRTLAVARKEDAALGRITVQPDGSLDGFEALAADESADAVGAAATLIAHLLGLLATFVGEPLALRLVRQAWPDEPLHESPDE